MKKQKPVLANKSKVKIPVNSNHKLTLKSTVAVSKSQASSELLGEAVILELKSGVYYGLNETGSLIWNLIQQSKTLEEIRDAILEEYEVESDLCVSYMLQLVQDLADKGLVVIKNEAVV
ncbi:MAG: PqqD family protein [Xenococcaceae cyanobacterium MO_188.B19]|nr:PqqD family protein [Xenococcaceae cyanobacterium MO_188.B19]